MKYEEVVEGLKRQWVNVLVLDEKVINGFSVYQEIKQFHPSCQIVLIYEKGNGLVCETIKKMEYMLGIEDFLINAAQGKYKPYSFI